MDLAAIQAWIGGNQFLALLAIILFSAVGYFVARFIVGKGLLYIADRTETQVDDIIVEHLKPFRVAWLAPLIVIYIFADVIPDYQVFIETLALFFLLWVVVFTTNALLNALNDIYENSPNYSGVSIQGYLDLVKILTVLIGVIFSISVITRESPRVLLTSLGALTAVLLLVFKDTILSIVASIQISTQDLVKEGDWIEVPSYEADGEVLNMSLHTIKVQNWDKTITVIPTYRMTEVAYRNWRGMTECGGRRIKRSITIDMASIKFCDQKMLSRLSKIDLIHDFLDEKIQQIGTFNREHAAMIDSPLDGPQITNVEIYRAYMAALIRGRNDIHQDGLTFLIRALAPGREGLPIEVYVFTKTTDWAAYENIQGEIFDHLLAAVPNFDLRVFQEPTGMDFAARFGEN